MVHVSFVWLYALIMVHFMSRFSHGNHSVFSCRGIELAINWFLRRGHTQITAFVPQWRQRTVQYDSKTIKDRHLLNELEKRGHLTFTPARRVPGKAKNICCYDDR